MAACRVPPAVNQIELSPYCWAARRAVVDRCHKERIVVEAYSPLTQGKKLRDPVLMELGKSHDKTPAQVLIRWALQQDLVVLPKSQKPERIRANAAVFDFALSPAEMARLDALDENLIVSWDPTTAP